MALCSFIRVSHFLVKTLRIAPTKVFPISALSYKVWSPRTQEASDRTRARRRCLWQDAALPVPTGGRLWHSLCAVCRRGTCHWAPSPCTAGAWTSLLAPRCQEAVAAQRCSAASDLRGPFRTVRRIASHTTPSMQDPVPLPAPWLADRLVLSRLRLEQSAWTRGRSAPHARRQGGRAPPCATGSWLTHRHAWLQVGPLTGVPVRGPFCTLHVSRICVTVWPFFLRPPRGLGHGPCQRPRLLPRDPPTGPEV